MGESKAAKLNWKRGVSLLLKIVLTLGFLVAGGTKFRAGSGWVERFAGWGYSESFLAVIGVLEIVGAIGLWVPRASKHSVAMLALVMIGAVYTNVTHPPMSAAIRPLAFLLMLGAVGWLRADAGARSIRD